MAAIRNSGHSGNISIALDVAASGRSMGLLYILSFGLLEFQCADRPGFYNLDIKNESSKSPRILSGTELASLYIGLCEQYPSRPSTVQF